jgi:hypothetical protein
MPDSKLQVAKEFIDAMNYDVARAILVALPNDPTAQRWLAKLNEIAPKSKSVTEMSDEELIKGLDKKGAAEELVLRLLNALSNVFTYTQNRDRLESMLELLISKINDGFDIGNVLPTLMALALRRYEVPLIHGTHPCIQKAMNLIGRENPLARATGLYILRQMGTLSSRIALQGDARTSEAFAQIIIHKQPSDASFPAEILIVQGATLLFSVQIKAVVNKQGKIVYIPSAPRDIFYEYVDIAALVIEVALNVADTLNMRTRFKNQEEWFWDEYNNYADYDLEDELNDDNFNDLEM